METLQAEERLVLALDTATREGSIALLRGERVLAVQTGDATRSQAERLPGDIVKLLAAHGLTVSDIDLFAVAAGPGSFTGLRIGIATVQGLAFALGRSVVGVSVLEALRTIASGHGGPNDAALAAAWMDAQRNEVFAALYSTTSESIDGPVSEPPEQVLKRWTEIVDGRHVIFAGNGMVRYGGLVRQYFSDATVVDPTPPLAPIIGAIAMREAAEGRAVAPYAVRPIYIRRPDVELARLRSASFGEAGKDNSD